MSAEARVTSSLQIRKQSGVITTLDYQSRPSAFTVDVTGTKGPTPGAVRVSIYGTDISLTELTTPGLCRIMNLDPTNYVSVGVYDPDTAKYSALMEIGPGESYVFKLSRNLAQEYTSVGTSTLTSAHRLRLLANTAACNVVVEVFEK